jgi:hypothetical protein
MERREVELLINNEAEWRRHILLDLTAMKNNQTDLLVTVTTLKVKFGMIGAVFGSVAGTVAALVVDILKHK